MDNFLLVARQVVILFVLVGTGAVCRKTKLVDESSVRGMVNVLVAIVTPALIIECFQRPFERSMFAQFAIAFVVAATMHVLLILLTRFTARGDEFSRPVLRVATVFSNAGFMGIPLEYAILGPKGVFYGVVYVTMFNLFMWTWGIVTMRGRSAAAEGLKLREAIVNPGTIGLLIGFPLFLFSVTLPETVGTPIRLLSGLNTPLAMLVIGYFLAGADLKSVLRSGQAHISVLIRLVVSPIVLVGGFWLMRGRLDRTMMLALTISAAAPVGAMVAMFASRYRRDVDLAVGLVSGSTIVSVFTMPPVIAFAMSVL